MSNNIKYKTSKKKEVKQLNFNNIKCKDVRKAYNSLKHTFLK